MDIKRITIGGAAALGGLAALTAATTVNQAAIPAGMVSYFDRNCPTGWNDVTSKWKAAMS